MLILYGLSGTVLMLIGTILLGISIIRAKVFPRVTGILILVGGIITPVQVLGTGLISTLIGSVSIILIDVALLWIGYILLRATPTGSGEETVQSDKATYAVQS